MKTNSNSYTIVYAAVLVVIVAFLLAFVFQALRPAQEANVALDKQKQILYSLNIRGLQDQAAAAKYKEVVTADEIIDANGNVVDKGSKGGTAAGFKLRELTYDLHNSEYNEDNIVTEYEKNFSEKGFKINRVVAYL